MSVCDHLTGYRKPQHQRYYEARREYEIAIAPIMRALVTIVFMQVAPRMLVAPDGTFVIEDRVPTQAELQARDLCATIWKSIAKNHGIDTNDQDQ